MAAFSGRWRTLLTLAGLIALGADCVFAAEMQSRVTLLVYDYAGVPADTLREAQRATNRVFVHAGVEIVWRTCRLVDSVRLECPDPHPMAPGLRLVTRFRPARDRVGADAMGFTTGDLATVSVEFARKIEESGFGPMPEILGHLIAHEVGHLLLPGDGHAVNGIMRARWDRKEWTLLRQERLYFAPEQARFIRAELLTRIGRR